MNYIIDKAKPDDAESLLRYLKIVSEESDNLVISKEQIDEMTIQDESLLIESYLHNDTSLMMVAKYNDDIIGMGNLKGNSPGSKISHRVNLGVTVKKEYWNKGIGTELIDSLLSYASNNKNIEIVELEVKSDNYAAISLYERFGFDEIGYYENYFKYEDGYGDAILMTLQF